MTPRRDLEKRLARLEENRAPNVFVWIYPPGTSELELNQIAEGAWRKGYTCVCLFPERAKSVEEWDREVARYLASRESESDNY